MQPPAKSYFWSPANFWVEIWTLVFQSGSSYSMLQPILLYSWVYTDKKCVQNVRNPDKISRFQMIRTLPFENLSFLSSFQISRIWIFPAFRCPVFGYRLYFINLNFFRYMPIPPHPSRMDTPSSGNVEFLSYPQYIATAKQQTQFATEVRQILTQAAKDVVEHTYT